MELDGADASAIHVEVGAERPDGVVVGLRPVERVVGTEEKVALVADGEFDGAEGADELYVLVGAFHDLAGEGFVTKVDFNALEHVVLEVVAAARPLNNIRCAGLDFRSILEVEAEGAGSGVEAGLIGVEFHQRSISDKVVESVVFEVEGQAEGIPRG